MRLPIEAVHLLFPRNIAARVLALVNAICFGSGIGMALFLPVSGKSGSDYYAIESLTFQNVLWNNLQFSLLLFVLSCTLLWVVSAGLLLVNGYVLGTLIHHALGEGMGMIGITESILPHGVFEVTAFTIAGSVGITPTYQVVQYLWENEDRLIDQETLLETIGPLVSVVFLLLIAAFVEVTVSAAP